MLTIGQELGHELDEYSILAFHSALYMWHPTKSTNSMKEKSGGCITALEVIRKVEF
jgi:hypothetical protein